MIVGSFYRLLPLGTTPQMEEPAPKVVIVGDRSVGKTMLVQRMVYNTFTPQQPTYVCNFERLAVRETERGSLMVHIFDTAGEERFDALAPVFVRNASLALVCFPGDSTFAREEERIRRWISFVRGAERDCRIMLVLTKADIAEDSNITQFQSDCAAFILEMGLAGFTTTSAMSGRVSRTSKGTWLSWPTTTGQSAMAQSRARASVE